MGQTAELVHDWTIVETGRTNRPKLRARASRLYASSRGSGAHEHPHGRRQLMRTELHRSLGMADFVLLHLIENRSGFLVFGRKAPGCP